MIFIKPYQLALFIDYHPEILKKNPDYLAGILFMLICLIFFSG